MNHLNNENISRPPSVKGTVDPKTVLIVVIQNVTGVYSTRSNNEKIGKVLKLPLHKKWGYNECRASSVSKRNCKMVSIVRTT